MRYSFKYTLLTWALAFSAASATTINVPDEYPTIQTALTAAQSGDTVLVQPGIYYEDFSWSYYSGVKLISAGDSSNTIIDGGGARQVISIDGFGGGIDSSTEIRGFTITNASFSGIRINSASPLLAELCVTGNSADIGGGLHISYDSSPILQDMTVTGNSADIGGGIYISGGSPKLINVNVIGNVAGDNGRGGGIYISSNSSAILTDVTVSGNFSNFFGGGIYIAGGNPILNHVTVSGNWVEGFGDFSKGGGIFITGNSAPILTDVTVSGNSARGEGGGFFIDSSSPVLAEVTVSGNTAGNGGGFYITGDTTLMTNVTVTGNTATFGGGLEIYEGNPSLTDIIVAGNTAAVGGGLFISSNSNPILTSMTITENTATHDYSGRGIMAGGGIYSSISSSPSLENVTITGNATGIWVAAGGTPTITGSILAYNGVGLHNATNTNTIDATSNWWGHSSGPYHLQDNPGGLGDSVNAYVDITPFLTEPDTAAPPIPVQNPHVTEIGVDFFRLSWDASPMGDLAGYKVYYDTDSTGFPYADTVDVGADTSYTLSGLPLGTIFYLAVTCYDTDGNESWYSQELVAAPADPTAPAAPQNLVAVAGSRKVTLSWNQNTEANFLRYRIYGSTSPNPTTPVDSSANIADTARTVGGLTNDTTYYYRVSAVATSLNESGYSNEVSATPFNPPPVAVGDTVSTRENASVTVRVLDNDSDVDGDTLSVVSITQPDSGAVSIDPGDTTLTYSPNSDFNGQDSLNYVVSDGYGGLDTGMVLITVTPVNDPPEAFTLVSPGHNSTLVITSANLGDTLTFAWEGAADVDGDTVRYGAELTDGLDTLFTFGDTIAAEVRLPHATVVALMEGLGQLTITGTWHISATDGEDTTWASNGPFTFTVDATTLDVLRLALLPEEFALHPAYPNPFNPSSTLRFDLPEAAEVYLVVYDLLGREVARLVDRDMTAGYHQVIWDGRTVHGREVPTGIYIARLVTPQYTKSIKMLLLK